MLAEGVDVKTAQARLGHSDPRLTLAISPRQRPKATVEQLRNLGLD
jgi:hypothetical protein